MTCPIDLPFPSVAVALEKSAEAYGVWGEKTLYRKRYNGIIRSAFLIDGEGRILEA